MPGKLTPPVSRHDHMEGTPDAVVELVEYGDFQCPHCGHAYPIIKKIQQAFGKKLTFVFRHFPLSNVHPMAIPAAIASEAAARQQRFWQMHDLIFENQAKLSDQALLQFAMSLHLNINSFKMDLLDELLAEKVDSDFESGIRSGVNGTPSFYINGLKYNGAPDYASLHEAIELSLQQKELQ